MNLDMPFLPCIAIRLSPAQIISTPVSTDMEGFVFSQEICNSKSMVLNRIVVLLAEKKQKKLFLETLDIHLEVQMIYSKPLIMLLNIIRHWEWDAILLI